jgi:hypothetical protein
MKALSGIVVLGLTLSVSALTFAQTNSPHTRAQVRAELVELEQNGYHVGDGDSTTYPQPVQAAEAKIAAHAALNARGGASAGSTDSGTTSQ